MNDVNNNDNIRICNELFDLYLGKISDYVSDYKTKLKKIESDVDSLNNEINISSDFAMKAKYALSLVGKLFAVTVLGIRTEAVSFDTYKFFKMKQMGGNSDAELNRLKSLLDGGYKNLDFFSDFYKTLLEIKKDLILSPDLLVKFLNTFSYKKEDSNIFYRLFETCLECGIDVSDLVERTKNGPLHDGRVNLKIPLVQKINDCVKKYLNKENVKNVGRKK